MVVVVCARAGISSNLLERHVGSDNAYMSSSGWISFSLVCEHIWGFAATRRGARG
jgi:hypothetical protein